MWGQFCIGFEPSHADPLGDVLVPRVDSRHFFPWLFGLAAELGLSGSGKD